MECTETNVIMGQDMNKFVAVFVILLWLVGCGAAEDEYPGVCSLDCSSAKILGGAGRYEIIRLGGLEGSNNSFSCDSIGPESKSNSPLTFNFKVVEKGRAKIEYDGNGKIISTPAQPGEGTEVAGVAMNVITEGNIWSTNPDEVINAVARPDSTGSLFPAEYVGIATPIEEWCTDACGVFRVQLYTRCNPVDSKGTLTVKSGAVAAPPIEMEIDAVTAAAFNNPLDTSAQVGIDDILLGE